MRVAKLQGYGPYDMQTSERTSHLGGQVQNVWYVGAVKAACRSCEDGRVRLLARRMELGIEDMGWKAHATEDTGW